MTQHEQKENAIMKTLLFATAAVTALCVAAPASATVHHHYYGAYAAYGAYGAYRAYRPRRSANDYYYVPYNPNEALPQTDEACFGCGSDRRFMTSSGRTGLR